MTDVTHGPGPGTSLARWSAGDGVQAAGPLGAADDRLGAADDRLGAADDRLGAALDGPADALIRRLFAVGLDLHAALAHLREHIAEEAALARIQIAIGGLDQAIKDVRSVVFALSPREPAPPGGLRSLVLDAVRRVCGAAGESPAITLRGGIDAVADEATAYQVAELIQRILATVPAERLRRAHVEVAPATRPPARLLVQIDVPGDDLGDLTWLPRAADAESVVVARHTVTTRPTRSRITLEYPA